MIGAARRDSSRLGRGGGTRTIGVERGRLPHAPAKDSTMATVYDFQAADLDGKEHLLAEFKG